MRTVCLRVCTGMSVVGVAVAGVLALVSAATGLVAGTTADPGGTRSVPAVSTGAVGAPRLADVLGRLPLTFESDGRIFTAAGPGYSVGLSADGVAVRAGGSQLRMVPGAGSARVDPAGEGPIAGHVNRILGSDPTGWTVGLPSYRRVVYREVWPGIDMVLRGDGNHLEHDFVVAPGADPTSVTVAFDGADSLRIDESGDLLVVTPGESPGPVRFTRPHLFQEVDGARHQVSGSFRLMGPTVVGYTVGAYDRTRPLVIDPVLVTSTYLGGGRTDAIAAVAVDTAGALYLAGTTDSVDLVTLNPFQARLNPDSPTSPSDVFVAKIDPSGDKLAWATYLGGSSRDAAAGIAVASDGSVVVTGVTESNDFPLGGGSPAQKTYGGGPSDAFVARLDPTGSTLRSATYLGGRDLDSARAVSVDPFGAVYVTGSTSSSDFPSVNPIKGARKTSDVDAFVTKVNADGSTFVYSTRVGGTSDDHGLDLVLSDSGAVTFTGDTRSANFPTAKPLQAGIGGGATAGDANAPDAFVARLDPSGATLEYSTFLGGADSDQATGVALDAAGSIFVTGNTGSIDFPTENPRQAARGGVTDAFVSKIDGSGAVLVFSTYLGGGGADGATGIVVDGLGRPTVVGIAASTDFPLSEAFQPSSGGGVSDGFVTTLDAVGAVMVASSYIGGSDEDQATAVVLLGEDPIVVGSTASTNLATVKPVQATLSSGATDGYLARVSLSATAPPTTQEPDSTGSGSSSGTSAHERRVQVLVGITAVLFLLAVAQTAWLRRRGDRLGGSMNPAMGVRGPARPGPSIEDPEETERWSSASVLNPMAESDIGAEVPEEVVDDTSFWDLFPDDLPPHGRVPGDDEWWVDDLPSEDLLARRSERPTPSTARWAPPRRRGETSGEAEPDVMLTELLAGELAPPSPEPVGQAGSGPDLDGDAADDLTDSPGTADDWFADGPTGGDGGNSDPARRRASKGSKGKPRSRRSGRRRRPGG